MLEEISRVSNKVFIWSPLRLCRIPKQTEFTLIMPQNLQMVAEPFFVASTHLE